MSFWSSAAGPTFWQAARAWWTAKAPERLQGGDLPQIPFIPEPAQVHHIQAILEFWRCNFKNGRGPYVGYTAEQLGAMIADPNYDLLIVLAKDRIIGTVMARNLGAWTRPGYGVGNFQTSWIDMYCVAAEWRQRGVGRSLLFGIYGSLRLKGRESAVFLKEGAPLCLPPVCSSFYTWRRVRPEEAAPCVSQWSRADFEQWIHAEKPKNTIYNGSSLSTTIGSTTDNTLIVAYAAQNAWLIAAFTPAHQLHPEDGLPLIWMTGCATDGLVGPAEKKEAMRQLSTAAARYFGTHWIWTNGFYAPPDEIWNRDGLYHIYAFNWNPGIFFNGNPFIIF
jgi:hypothetical protein